MTAFFLLACPGDDAGDSGGDTSSGTTGGGPTTSPSTTTSPSSTDPGTTTGDESTGGSDSESGGTSSGSESGSTTTGGVEEDFAAGGHLVGLAGYESTTASGFALLTRAGAQTITSVAVAGLEPDTAYPAHVHAQACDDDAGGGHYKIDPTEEDTVEANEIWPAFTTDGSGVGRVEITTDHRARDEAVSIVVHDPNASNAKMLCADLQTSNPLNPFTTEGTSTLLPGAVGVFDDLSAEATMERDVGTGTNVDLQVTGLNADTEYPAHVHDQTCGSNSGGGHYKIDYSNGATEEDNELWLTFTTDGDGEADISVSDAHEARAGAMAVVIHDTDGTRLACIDLAE